MNKGTCWWLASGSSPDAERPCSGGEVGLLSNTAPVLVGAEERVKVAPGEEEVDDDVDDCGRSGWLALVVCGRC